MVVVVMAALMGIVAGDGISNKEMKESPLLRWRALGNTKGEVVLRQPLTCELLVQNKKGVQL